MKKLIHYFTENHLISNVLFFGVLILSIFVSQKIGKEEMPEFTSNWLSINTSYPGASAEDVELFVTKILEDEIKGVSGIEQITSTSSTGTSSIRIVIDEYYPKKAEVVQDIKDAVSRARLPSEVRKIPKIRQFKSSEKAIIDIGIYLKSERLLSEESRKKLQKFAASFENQIVALDEISSVDRTNYLKPELQILVNSKLNRKLDISLSEIKDQISSNHIRVPIGSLSDKDESRVSIVNEYEDVESLLSLILRGNYEGLSIPLRDVATIKEGFESSNTIFKVNGHEAILLNIKKSSSVDILTAQKSISKFIKNLKQTENFDFELVLLDDESYAVKNRLKIIFSNGLMGFLLIVLVLLLFLNLKSGFWVSMGIPFSMAFTLITCYLLGFSINNMTLAGIIIVLGIVVDDAIIIAENIMRKINDNPKKDKLDLAIEGVIEVIRPIIGSIITTCIAFLPLIYFEGFFGKLVSYIPPIIILMLLGSLIESVFILPSHMIGRTFLIDRVSERIKVSDFGFLSKIEYIYEKMLLKFLNYRFIVITLFVALFSLSLLVFTKNMKYVMFPREESEEVVFKVKAPKGTAKQETSLLIDSIEKMLVDDVKNVVGIRSTIGQSRRGGEVNENEATILVELFPADEREVKLKDLISNWEEQNKTFKDLESVKIIKSRWGRGSGSAIEIEILESDDHLRNVVSNFLIEQMKKYDFLIDVELEEVVVKNEYVIKLNQEKLIKYDISPNKVTTSLKTFVEGVVVYTINKGDEEIDVKLSVDSSYKKNLDEILQLKVENKKGSLISLDRIIEITKEKKPVNIKRSNFKRSQMLYADLNKNSQMTPLEVAEKLENTLFREVKKVSPSTILNFKGEIEDSRSSQGEFVFSILLAIILIYVVLVIIFNSLFKPLIVISIIPFGLSGVIFTLYFHAMNVYGFFAVVGALGMIGVVINDTIVMIDKFDRTLMKEIFSYELIAKIATTRLRPILLTTVTTVVGVLPTAYGVAGFDSMLSEMMLVMGWGLAFGTFVTIFLIPCFYTFFRKT